MMTPGSRDPTALSDPRVDAAWRALSGEEPPKSLDAAILAAARREVGAKPQRTATQETIADHRRWWPLAAAATVAAIAVGVLQLTMPEQLGAPALDKTLVSDMPTPAAAPEAATTPPRAEAAKPDASDTDARAGNATPHADSPRRPVPALEPRESPKREPAPGNTPAMAEPFPAAPPQPAVAAPAAAGQIAAPAPSPQPATAASAQESAAARLTPLAKMAAGRAADSSADEARAKDRAPLPVADWIALIRRLRDEGKSAEAAKELAAFRAAHVDHDKLLPPDLRD